MTYETIVTKEISSEEESFDMSQKTNVYQFFSNFYKLGKQSKLYLATLWEKTPKLKNVYIIHVGEVNEKLLDIKGICHKAIEDNASEIIMCTMRSSSADSLEPTENDYDIAGKIFQAMQIINTRVRYQLIIGYHGYTEIKLDENTKHLKV
jgi:DNA repair protein RadC